MPLETPFKLPMCTGSGKSSISMCVQRAECVVKAGPGPWTQRVEAQSLFGADPLPSFLPASIQIHLLLTGRPCKSLFHRGPRHRDITNQREDEAELLMLTEWNTEGGPRWRAQTNLGQRPRRDTKMHTHPCFHFLCVFFWLLHCPCP